MLNLIDYSDSDSDAEGGTVSADSTSVIPHDRKMPVVGLVTSSNDQPADDEPPNKKMSFDLLDTKTKNNFFNLDVDSSDEEAKEEEEISPPLVVKIGESLQEIDKPKAKYWENFKPSVIVQEPPCQTGQNNLKRWANFRTECNSFPQSKLPKPSKGSYNDPVAATSSELPNRTKKIFYFHHKISPHLMKKSQWKCPNKKSREIVAHAGVVNRVKWSTKAQYSHLLLSVSMDSTVKIWNMFTSLEGNEPLQTFTAHKKAVKDAAWSSCGKEIVTASYDRTAKLLDAEKGTDISTYDHHHYVSCIKFHPSDCNLFITGCKDSLYCWDKRQPSQPNKMFSYKDSFNQVQDIMFLEDGQTFLSCNDIVTRDSSDRNIMAWDYRNAAVVSNQIYQERFTCTRLVKCPTDSSFIAQTQGNYIAKFSSKPPFKMDKCKRLESHKVLGYNIGCDISKDGRLVISGSTDGRLYCYDYHTGKLFRNLPSYNNNDVCMDVAWHPVLYSTVASSSWDGKISLWQ